MVRCRGQGQGGAAAHVVASVARGMLYTGAMEPVEVQQVRHGDVAEATLQRVVRHLRADPAWSVSPSVEQPAAHILRFVYRPQQRADAVHALRVQPARWHIVPPQPRVAARSAAARRS